MRVQMVRALSVLLMLILPVMFYKTWTQVSYSQMLEETQGKIKHTEYGGRMDGGRKYQYDKGNHGGGDRRKGAFVDWRDTLPNRTEADRRTNMYLETVEKACLRLELFDEFQVPDEEGGLPHCPCVSPYLST